MISDEYIDFENWIDQANLNYKLQYFMYFWTQFPVPYLDVFNREGENWRVSKRFQKILDRINK